MSSPTLNFSTYTIQESFDSHGLNPTDFPTNITPTIDVNSIINQKILPVIAESQDYTNELNRIQNNYSKIENKLYGISKQRNILNNNNKYDYKGSSFNYHDERPSIQEAVIADSTTMIYNQNNIYILGTMTAATMVIIGILLARE